MPASDGHTFNGPPSLWAPYFGPERVAPESVASHRATTSSRTPGHVNRGTVRRQGLQLVVCPKCGKRRYDLGGPHSPHWRGDELVDCVGARVR